MSNRILYLLRIFQAYLGGGKSQLSFWHETPMLNEGAFVSGSNQFYMSFRAKAMYQGSFDAVGIPMLDYRGVIGRQYNPIAIAQYGLGCWNLAEQGERKDDYRKKALLVADWLADHLEVNSGGVPVWMHHFDWEYYKTLKAPWYSGLAQGQGVALLVRAWRYSGDQKYLEAADRAFKSLVTPINEGGCLFVDGNGDWWIEEYITEPSTHILNGFIWALWGVFDYAAVEQSAFAKEAAQLWSRGCSTVAKNLDRFDSGYWSLYDLSPTSIRNLASPFYHKLHLVQLDVMRRLTGHPEFERVLERWARYQQTPLCRRRALVGKAIFKLLYF